jgi:hypothetical protein
MSERHTGEAEPIRTSAVRQNAPFRQLHETGHHLNHSYKVPAPSLFGEKTAENTSYMSPVDHGKGITPVVPPKVWGRVNSVKSINQQGPGKTGPVRIS